MKIVEKKIVDLKPYKNNPKAHTTDQIEGIAESIRRFGFTQPIVIDHKGTIIIGHGRFEAAKIAKLPTVPCVMIEGLRDNEIKALRLLDNRLAETGWDPDLLKLEFEGFKFDFEPFKVTFDILPAMENVTGVSKDQDEAIKDSYSKMVMRQIILYFDEKDYDDVIKMLDKVGEKESIETYSEIVAHLLKNYAKNNR